FARTIGIGRKAQVDNGDRRAVTLDEIQRLHAVAGGQHLVLRKQPAILRANSLVVIQHQNGGPALTHRPATFCAICVDTAALLSARGNIMRMIVPLPRTLMTSKSPPTPRTISRAWKAPMP